MKNLSFKREEILEAIELEVLTPGSLVTPKDNASKHWRANKENCNVCAVGGLFRRRFSHKAIDALDLLITPYVDWSESVMDRGSVVEARLEAARLIDKGLHLNALSVLFETYAKVYGLGDELRKQLALAVKALFPRKFTAKDCSEGAAA